MPLFRNQVLYLLLAVAAFVALAFYLVLHSVLNADEGFYLAASHFVSQGYRPYHDFGYTQGPLFPYINLVWLELFGHSLAGQRMAGLAWTALTLAVGVGWLRRQHSWEAATVFVVFLLGAPVWLAFAVKGKTYALAGLAVLVGAKALLDSWPMWIRWLVFVGAAALGTGARLPVAGFFAPAFVGLLLLTPSWRNRLRAAALNAIIAAAILYTFGGDNWDRFVFWTTGFHRDSSFYIPVWTHFVDTFRFAPVLWVFAVVAALSLRARLCGRGNPGEKLDASPRRFAPREDNAKAQLIVLVSLAVAFVSNLSASTTYAEYIFPFIPALAFIVAPLAAEHFTLTRGSSRSEPIQPRMAPINTDSTEKELNELGDRVVREHTSIRDDLRNPWWISHRSLGFRIFIILTTVLAGWNYPPEFGRDLLRHAGQAEVFLRENVPPGARVACSMPEVAIAAGARVPLTMAMGKFGVTEDFDAEVAAERRMLTSASLQRILRDPNTKALVGSPSYNWNFFWSLPSYRLLSASAREQIHTTIRDNFRLEFMNEEYVIYLRRK